MATPALLVFQAAALAGAGDAELFGDVLEVLEARHGPAVVATVGFDTGVPELVTARGLHTTVFRGTSLDDWEGPLIRRMASAGASCGLRVDRAGDTLRWTRVGACADGGLRDLAALLDVVGPAVGGTLVGHPADPRAASLLTELADRSGRYALADHDAAQACAVAVGVVGDVVTDPVLSDGCPRDDLPALHALQVSEAPDVSEPASQGDVPALVATLDWLQRHHGGLTLGVVEPATRDGLAAALASRPDVVLRPASPLDHDHRALATWAAVDEAACAVRVEGTGNALTWRRLGACADGQKTARMLLRELAEAGPVVGLAPTDTERAVLEALADQARVDVELVGRPEDLGDRCGITVEVWEDLVAAGRTGGCVAALLAATSSTDPAPTDTGARGGNTVIVVTVVASAALLTGLGIVALNSALGSGVSRLPDPTLPLAQRGLPRVGMGVSLSF